MKVSLKKAFSLLDGRLSTKLEDVYEMLNYIFSENFSTHQLTLAFTALQNNNPKWFKDGVELIQNIKDSLETDDFETIINHIDLHHSETFFTLTKIN